MSTLGSASLDLADSLESAAKLDSEVGAGASATDAGAGASAGGAGADGQASAGGAASTSGKDAGSGRTLTQEGSGGHQMYSPWEIVFSVRLDGIDGKECRFSVVPPGSLEVTL